MTAYEIRISDWSSDVCSSDLEIAFGCGGAIGLDRGKTRLVGHRPGILAVQLLPFVEQREQRLDTLRPAEAEENPASFLAALGEPGVDQYLHVTGDARLALPQHLRQLAHRQFHRAQEAQDAETRGIGERPEEFGGVEHQIRI